MKQLIHSHAYDNGLVLVAEPIRSLESAAFTLLVPAGSVHEPEALGGLAAFACEMSMRGAGSRDGRQLIHDLESLGVDRGESVSDAHVAYSGATLAKNLPAALAIYADVIQRPHLPAPLLEAGRQVLLQELQSVEDEPSHKVMLELRKNRYPSPWGRPSQGHREGLETITLDDVRAYHERLFRPTGAILSVAGNIDWEPLKDLIGEAFGAWSARERSPIVEGQLGPSRVYIPSETNQTQIGVSYASVPYRHPDYFQAWGAVGALSGGMSARLFTEVREKRGLCYSIYASYHTLRDRGSVLCYAGTSAERAQETLDVLVAELQRLAKGIEKHEVERLKARIKSALIMQQESSSARSSAVARDWYHLGRVRTLDEISGLIDALSHTTINAYLAQNPPSQFTVAILGPKDLEVPIGVS